ncbi:MAG: tRNA lysidine(34) synthetase TilS [Gammaproteobacteria bacterium]
MSRLIRAVADFCTQYGFDKTYWVGFSGGLDSTVLLDACASLRVSLPIKLNAIYINHGLSPNAHIWAAHCEQVCVELSIPFYHRAVQLDLSDGVSLEEVAREGRYKAFASLLEKDDVLLTAHHQDDQAETMLLQLFRGAGPKGLSAMPSMKSFAQGYQGRPLLAFTRAALETYAAEQALTWIEDESNLDTTFSRNFLRNDILPLLKKHWPGVTKSIARSAAHCSETQALLDDFSKKELLQIAGSKPDTLSVSQLLTLPIEKRRLLLRAWIDQQGFLLPDTKRLQSICTSVLTAAKDRFPCVQWGDIEVRRYQDDLYLMDALLPLDVLQEKEWDFSSELEISGLRLKVVSSAEGLSQAVNSVTVRFRRGGEVINLPGRGSHTLKNLFQEWQVPIWLRDRIPLLFIGDKLIAVVGYAIDVDYVVKPNEPGRAFVQDFSHECSLDVA